MIVPLLFVLFAFGLFSSYVSREVLLANGDKPNMPTEEELQKLESFERDIWPHLQEKICPNGVPNLELGPTLFELGREELGISDELIFPGLEPGHKPPPIEFYDGIYEASVFIDGYDTSNSLLYPSIWKCANDQIHTYLELITNRDGDGEVKDIESAFGHWNDTIKWRLNTEKKFQNVVTDFDLSNSDQKACVFTVVRDPISRVLSGYNEVEYRLNSGESMSPATLKMVKPPYTTIPGYSLNNGKKASEKDLERRFETFVRNLVQEHPSISKQANVYRHIHPMSKIIHPLKRSDLLPSESNWFLELNEDITNSLPVFLAKKCPRLANIHRTRSGHRTMSEQSDKPDKFPGFPPMPVDGQHESSADPYGIYKAAKAVLKEGRPVIRALCHVYAPDYACFYSGKGASPLGARDIPAICRDVYSSELFQNAV